MKQLDERLEEIEESEYYYFHPKEKRKQIKRVALEEIEKITNRRYFIIANRAGKHFAKDMINQWFDDIRKLLGEDE